MTSAQPHTTLLLFLIGCGARTELRGSVPDTGAPIALCGIAADSGGGTCSQPSAAGLTCCDGVAVNLENDPLNCGQCGHRCAASEMCRGTCQPPSCEPVCDSCQVCCFIQTAGPWPPPSCVDGPTCPVGCPQCT